MDKVPKPVEDILLEEGLMLSPLNNGDWICGKGSHIYTFDIMEDHYADPYLGVGATAREAIERALAKGLGRGYKG